MRIIRSLALSIVLVQVLISWSCQKAPTEATNERNGLQRIQYNNPGLVVDLGVGLCSLPIPVDYNEDGLVDLVVTAGQDVPDGYTYFFENTGEKKDGVEKFKPGVRLGPKHEFFTPSYVDGNVRLLAFNREYDLYDLTKSWEIYPTENIHSSKGRVRANQWSYVDFNGDDVLDLVVGIGDWADYGWDDNFNQKGEWTGGPLHGYVYLIANQGTNNAPDYNNPEMISTSDGKPIDVYGRPSPNFADFDQDGDLDLITGEFIDKLSFFENIGTRTNPKYKPGQFLMVNDEPIRLKGCMIRPVAYDWDQDGYVDLIVGAEEGSVALIKNTGQQNTTGMPVFEPPRYFKQLANEVKVGVLATPFGVDWNGDGLQDIVSGNAAGNITFIENMGGDPPKWAAPKMLEVNGTPIHIMAGYNGSIQGPAEEKWGYTVVCVADWNGDGLSDLIINSILGKVEWYENIGAKTDPLLAEPRPIEVAWDSETPKPPWDWRNPKGQELVTQWRSSVQAIDLNNDGLLDLVALDQEGFLAYFERKDFNGDQIVMPPKRIFFVEKDSASVFNDKQQPIQLNSADMVSLAGYDERGELAYVGRNWEGNHWGPFKITHRVPRINDLAQTTLSANGLIPLRMNGGWAGRSGRRKFIFADWTGDGRLDILVNSKNVNLLENISDSPGRFVFRDRGNLDQMRLAGHTSCPTVVDWDRDKKPDLLVGAEDGFLYYLSNNF